MVTMTTGDLANSDALAAECSCIHFMENVRSPETMTGFFGLKK
jgi:hypothetical protein